MQLSIRQKLIGFAVIAIVILACQGLYSLYVVREINASMDDIYTNRMPSIMAAGDLKYTMTRHRVAVARGALIGQEERAATWAKVDEIKLTVDASIANYRKLISEAEEQKTFDQVMATWKSYMTLVDDMRKKNTADDISGAEHILAKNSYQTFNDLVKQIGQLEEINKSHATEDYHEAETFYSLALSVTIALLALGSLLLGGMAYVVISGIGKGMRELGRAFNALSGLDLRVRSTSTSEDEIGQSLKQYNDTANQLVNVVRGVQEAANTVSAAAHELSAGMESIGSVTAQQEHALTDIASSLEETSASATEVNTKAQRSGKVTGDVVEAIRHTVENVGSLRDSATKIGDVLSIITDISEQINLLALNAAIEAARAGDAGRGFAVVADEVRKLAGSTQSSISQIGEVVKSLQASVDDTSTSLEQVTGTLDEVRSNAESMVTAVGQQTIAVRTISESIGEFRSQMVSVMRNVDESRSAAASLSASAEELNAQSSKFRV